MAAGFTIMDLVNTKSSQAAAGRETDYEETYLDPREVKEAPQNTRQECKNIEQLADSFLLVGQEQPTVLGKVNGEYRIVDGHRRNRANILNLERGYEKYKRIRYFYKEMSETMYELRLLAGNGYTQDLTDYEKTELAGRLKVALEKARDAGEIEISGRVRDIVGDILGEKPTNMARIEKINNNLTGEAKEEFKKGNIGISAAYETAKLPEEEQKKIAEQAAAGEEVRAKDVAERVQEKKDKQRIREMKAEADRAEAAAKKARESQVAAAQATVQAERAAENADTSAQNMMNPPIVSESDTEKGQNNWGTKEWVQYTLSQLQMRPQYITEDELYVLQDMLVRVSDREHKT